MAGITVTRFPAPFFWASRGDRSEISWSEITALLQRPDLWPGDASPELAETRVSGWAGAVFRDDARVIRDDMEQADQPNRERVEAVHTLLVDYEDDPAVDVDRLTRWWKGYRFVAYTSAWHDRPWRNRPAGPRWRVLLPLSRGCTVDEAEELTRWVRHPRHGVGMVAPITEKVWRAAAAPAMNPGGFHACHRDGAPVDVDASLRQLKEWRNQDRRVSAEQALGDGLMRLAVEGFGRRMSERSAPSRPSVWPGPPPAVDRGALRPAALPSTAGTLGIDPGGPRPGRLTVLAGPPSSGRTAFALQVAANNALAGSPVLYVATRMTADEGLARLMAFRASGAASADAVLARAAPADDVSAALTGLVRDLSALCWWTPGAHDRDGEGLGARAKAAADLCEGKPPLVVIDALESWDGPEDQLAGALFDVLRPDTLGPGWPGAEVLALDRSTTGPAWSGCEALATASGDLGLREGPVLREASRLLGLLVEGRPGPDPRPACLRVLRDRLSPPSALALTFDGVRGRFQAAGG
ncbi:MAG: hypothetical protein H6738_01525 [Alphaproteobacteria bacterium]|nr:hypothetical protein [Alphaproteobacteria bacterium]MCB9695448.1 hypothetical protein [Alphaproteobacteria bacterium]